MQLWQLHCMRHANLTAVTLESLLREAPTARENDGTTLGPLTSFTSQRIQRLRWQAPVLASHGIIVRYFLKGCGSLMRRTIAVGVVMAKRSRSIYVPSLRFNRCSSSGAVLATMRLARLQHLQEAGAFLHAETSTTPLGSGQPAGSLRSSHPSKPWGRSR